MWQTASFSIVLDTPLLSLLLLFFDLQALKNNKKSWKTWIIPLKTRVKKFILRKVRGIHSTFLLKNKLLFRCLWAFFLLFMNPSQWLLPYWMRELIFVGFAKSVLTTFERVILRPSGKPMLKKNAAWWLDTTPYAISQHLEYLSLH